jgi:hypothetical protein
MNEKTTLALGDSVGLAISEWACLNKCVPCRMCEYQDYSSPAASYTVTYLSSDVVNGSTNWGLTYTDPVTGTHPAPLISGIVKITQHYKVDLSLIGGSNVFGFCKPHILFQMIPGPSSSWAITMDLLNIPTAYNASIGYHNHVAAQATLSFLSCSITGPSWMSGSDPSSTVMILPSGYSSTPGVWPYAWFEGNGIPPVSGFPTGGIFTFDMTITTDSLIYNETNYASKMFINRMIANIYAAPSRRRIRVPIIGVYS